MAPIVFEDDVYGLVFSAARASESLRHVDYEVGVGFAVINNRRRGAGRPHTLGYGRLCEALPFFPCGVGVLAPIGRLTFIREVDLNEYAERGVSEGEQKAVLVESNGTVLFARPWGALVNRSEELFQLVKIVTAALLVLEALYRQLGYGRLAAIECLPQ